MEAPCDGLVTDEERAVIDRVLKYENLGRRYNPDKSDAVKNCFNEYASQEDIDAYFAVWAQMFKKDPECYISALINNYYGYFYPSARDAWVYSTARSAEIMARPDNLKYFDFHPVDSNVVRWCDHLINLYRVAVQHDRRGGLPAASSFMACAGDLGAAVGCARRVPDWPVQRLNLHALPVSGYRLHALCHRRHRHPQRLPLILTWCIGVRFLCAKGAIITTPSFWGLSRRPVGIS